MKIKYCYECKGSKTSSKIHHWVRDGSGCKCKLCGIIEYSDEVTKEQFEALKKMASDHNDQPENLLIIENAEW